MAGEPRGGASATGHASSSAGSDLSRHDPYRVLEISPDAEREVIDAAYRALARKYHPDVNHSPDAQRHMQALNDAYALLRDPARRATFDTTRHPTHRPPPSPPPASTARPKTPAAQAALARSVLRAAVGDAFAPWRSARAREASRRFALGALGVVVATLLAWSGYRMWSARQSGGTLATYWRAAGDARTQVDAARQRLQATGVADYASAAGNTTFAQASTDLVNQLDAAAARLRAVPRVPQEAEVYHFLQLGDWQEERQLRLAFRVAALSRNPSLWAQTADQMAAWLASPEHQQTATLAQQLAGLAAGR